MAIITDNRCAVVLIAKLTETVELTDADGRTIGYFILPKQFDRIEQLEEDRRALYAWGNSFVTDEELVAAEAEGGDYSYEDIQEMFRKLEALERAKSA